MLIDSFKSIEVRLLAQIRNLEFFRIELVCFERVVNQQGIDWLMDINSDLNVNMSDSEELVRNRKKIITISILPRSQSYANEERFFPNQDFCIYKVKKELSLSIFKCIINFLSVEYILILSIIFNNEYIIP